MNALLGAGWLPMVALLAGACGGKATVTPVPGEQPMTQADGGGSSVSNGSSASGGAKPVSTTSGSGGGRAGGGAGTAPPPQPCHIYPAATITAQLSSPVGGTPDGLFTACRNTLCVAGLVAGVASIDAPHVQVDAYAHVLKVTWLDSLTSSGPDVYSLKFSPTGSGATFELFSTMVNYGVLPLAPDSPGPSCPSVVFVGQMDLMQPVDLYGSMNIDGGMAVDGGSDAGTNVDAGAH